MPTCALGEPESLFKLVVCEIARGDGGERRLVWDAAGVLHQLGDGRWGRKRSGDDRARWRTAHEAPTGNYTKRGRALAGPRAALACGRPRALVLGGVGEVLQCL